MDTYRHVHDVLSRAVTDGFLGTVSVGSLSYLEVDQEDEDADIDLIMLTKASDWPVGREALRKLRDMLELVGCGWTMVVVNARVPILKCVVVCDTDPRRRAWSVDILHQVVAEDVWIGSPGRMVALDDATRMLPTHSAIALAVLLRTRLGSNHEPESFKPACLVRLRRWAKYNHMYGSTLGYPGGSAWAVLLLIFCTIDSAQSTTLLSFVGFLHNWLTCHVGVPLTVHNARAIGDHGGDLFTRHADWSGLRHSIHRYARVMCIVPLPTEMMILAHNRENDINMTATVGPLQHGVMIWEMQRMLSAKGLASSPSRGPVPDCDFVLLFERNEGDDVHGVLRWMLHIEARGLLLLTNQLHLHNVCTRVFYWCAVDDSLTTPDTEHHRLPYAIAVWNTQLEVTRFVGLITTLLSYLEQQYRQEHGCSPPCVVTVRPVAPGKM